MNNKLLIVEDEENIAEIIAELLNEQFSQINKVTNIDSAISISDNQKFDLIILDINLAGRNGAELIKYIINSENNPNKDTKVLISSGIINQDFIKKNFSKFAGIIIKPFDHQELIELVHSILANEKINYEVLNDDSNIGIPQINCEMPFSVPQLQTKVNKIIEATQKNTKIKDFFKSINYKKTEGNYFEEHIGLLINISTAISLALEWNTDKTLEKFVYAAYLHDMALADRPDLAKIKNRDELEKLRDTLNTEDFNLIFHHPTIASQKINTITEIPSDVGQIVIQHHENPKESGFPNKISNLKISPLAAIFIAAHDMTDFIILSNEEYNLTKYLAHYKKNFRGSTFNKIALALEKLNN